MLLRALTKRPRTISTCIRQMSTAHLDGAHRETGLNGATGSLLRELPKSNVFTSSLPPDPEFPTPHASHKAPRSRLGPRMVKGALYTFVRPERSEEPEVLGVSQTARKDIGLSSGEENSQEFKDLVSGNKILWDEENEEGIYPWAQCYGGWQFGSWAGQLGDGRAISLFETTNPDTKVRYELQLKGAGKTPYSRFADGKAVLRSSIREFVVSEALNGLRIPTTRALSLTLLANSRVHRERVEPGAIVLRFAQSWLRIGTFDLLRARGDRGLVRRLSDYIAEHVYSGWESLPALLDSSQPITTAALKASAGVDRQGIQGAHDVEENRYTRLYRAIVRRNALTVAAWQAYGFTNGVLNTDNTSILGLSLDFGPFAFLDNFDPSYTPNHDDHMLRYSYKNQPSIIWWNLVRLGETLGELIGSGSKIDDPTFVDKGVDKDFVEELVKRAETIIENVGEEYKAVFLAEYQHLMRARLGLKSEQANDFDELFSELLDTLEALELDFNHFFRRLSSVRVGDLEGEDQRKGVAVRFFHKEGIPQTANVSEEAGRERVGQWLARWAERVRQDWGTDSAADEAREREMKRVNPNFIPRSWILDEVIKRVEHGREREVIGRIMRMSERPFEDHWHEGDEEATKEEERWCGDVPREVRGMQCSCSS